MLSEAVLASMETREWKKRSTFSLSLGSPCPMRTWYSLLDFHETKKVAPRSRLNMEDGEFQEQSVLYWLRNAGFTMLFTGKEQMEIHAGRLNIPGHPDGIILIGNEAHLLEIKGMNLKRFTDARYSGLEKHQGIRFQVQSYLASKEFRSLGIDKVNVYFKHKENSNPYDIQLDYEPGWINPILDTTCDILDGTLIPQPVEIPMCEDCSKADLCWPDRSPVIDTENFVTASLPEAEEMYDKGKAYETMGKIMQEEAKEKFEKALGNGDVMFLDAHKVKRVYSSNTSFDKIKFINLFGVENLDKVRNKKEFSYIRVDLTGED